MTSIAASLLNRTAMDVNFSPPQVADILHSVKGKEKISCSFGHLESHTFFGKKYSCQISRNKSFRTAEGSLRLRIRLASDRNGGVKTFWKRKSEAVTCSFSSNSSPNFQAAPFLDSFITWFATIVVHVCSRWSCALKAASCGRNDKSRVKVASELNILSDIQTSTQYKAPDSQEKRLEYLSKLHQVLAFFNNCNSCGVREIHGQPLLQQGGLGLALGLLSITLSGPAVAQIQLKDIMVNLRGNSTFMSALIAWTIAQGLKVFTTYAVERRFDMKMVMASGGMPSSHSALVIALTVSVALLHGCSGPLFPVCLGFSLIVMYDATGVRYHAGMQAEVLNVIVADLFQGHPVSEKKLKELLGHTPSQVGAGAMLGAVVAYLYSTSSWAAVGA